MKILNSFCMAIIISSCSWRPSEQRNDKNCINQCGIIEIPYPFGIGPDHCYLGSNFAVSCRSSSSTQLIPFLEKLNLEILNVKTFFPNYIKNEPYGRVTTFFKGGRVTVRMPSVAACSNSSRTDTKVTWTSHNLTDSPFSFSKEENVFASMGCDGYALLYDDTYNIIAGCTSVCSLNPPTNIESRSSNISKCYGYHCCQAQLASAYISKQYSVSVSGNCRSAFLISKQHLEDEAPLSPEITDVPVELLYSANDQNSNTFRLLLFLPIILSVVIAFVICGGCWMRWRFKTKRRRKEIKLRAKYFKEKLEMQGSSNSEVTEKTKLFTLTELKRITDNFNNDRVIGQGGQGTVYKGMLKDGQVIAVKRSRTLDSSQWKQFINEVILLSEIKHRHVVKILGCCLEDDIPLVVYEFICNGTLSEHIHKSIDELVFTWEMRLRIAFETATAIAHLHSEFSSPIYHRDIKSSNILLDDKFGAKLSDFGISRAVSVEQTHLTTCVQGTFGYLDPEYFYSGQYSEKSDVYSFGVMLAELLTGQKPIRAPRVLHEEEESEDEEERSLAMYFISSVNNDTLFDIVDPMILESGKKEDVIRFANLAKQCLNPTGLERPTMKEVAMVLDRLRRQNSPLKQTDQVGDWTVGSSSMITSFMETDNGYLGSLIYDHTTDYDPINVEMRLLHTC